MMPLERRNEPQMLRQFSRLYPSFNLNPLLRRRQQQLVEAQAFNAWLSNRRLQQEGESYTDELGRMTEAVNRRIPQLRYAPAERAGVHRMARDVAAGRNTSALPQVHQRRRRRALPQVGPRGQLGERAAARASSYYGQRRPLHISDKKRWRNGDAEASA